MVKFILIKSPDEWATTKQACRDELVVYVFFSSVYIYIYIYIYITLGEFHTDKSRIVLNNNGAVITMFFYSI